MWTVMKQIQLHFIKNIDYKIFTADKPGRMNTKFSNFTLHLFIKTDADTGEGTCGWVRGRLGEKLLSVHLLSASYPERDEDRWSALSEEARCGSCV